MSDWIVVATRAASSAEQGRLPWRWVDGWDQAKFSRLLDARKILTAQQTHKSWHAFQAATQLVKLAEDKPLFAGRKYGTLFRNALEM